jgi:CYTH domain-containing protein
MEIERKFLVGPSVPDVSHSRSSFLRQGYLAVGPTGEVRIRDADGRFTLAAKSHGGLVRDEFEVAITSEQFCALWPATEGRRVEKRRYALECGQHTCHLDLYAGRLAHLTTVEVEFDTIEDALAFERPDWFGVEVTKDERYRNAALAHTGCPPAEAAD